MHVVPSDPNCPHRIGGEKVTETEQVVLIAIQQVQLLVCAKSPLAVIEVTFSTASPMLVMVNTAGPEVVATVWLPKLIAVTPMLCFPFPFFPVQDKLADCVTEASLSVKTTDAVSAPATTGAQVIVAEQFPPGKTVLQLLVIVKLLALGPVSCTFDTKRFPLPILFNVAT